MRTEEELIYIIWEIVRAGIINDDDPLNERILRGFLQLHRGKHLNRYYNKGQMIPDEAFQTIGTVNFTALSDANEFISNNNIPKIIRLPHNAGIAVYKNSWSIPILNSEEYENASYNKFNKYPPRIKFIDGKFTLNIGMQQLCVDSGEDLDETAMNLAIRNFASEKVSNTVNVFARAVLVNPEDGLDYDWTVDPYPMPDELIEDLINSVNAREFNIYLRQKSDETGDARHNISQQHTPEEI